MIVIPPVGGNVEIISVITDADVESVRCLLLEHNLRIVAVPFIVES